MRQLTRLFGIFAVALLLVACDQGGNGGPGVMLPEQGSHPSYTPAPSAGPCQNGVTKQTVGAGMTSGTVVDGGNCATVPNPYGSPKKDPVPGISFPDFPGKTEFQSLPGGAFTLLVVTTAVDSATLSCAPANVASLVPSGLANYYLFYLNAMPNQDVPCTISATGPKGDAKVAIVVHPAPENTVIPLEVRNFPSIAEIDAGKTKVIPNFYIQGYNETTTVVTSCKVDPKPTLTPIKNFTSWYNLTVTAAPSPVATDACTVTATRQSDGQTDSASVTMQYEPGPTIRPINFLASAKLPLVLNKEYFAVVDPASLAPELPKLNINQADTVTMSCTDDHNAGLSVQTVSDAKPTYTLTISYNNIGVEGSTDTCTVIAKDQDNRVSGLTIKVAHIKNPSIQSIINVPATKSTTTGGPIDVSNIKVEPMEEATDLGIQCVNDKKATVIKQADQTFTAMITPISNAYSADKCILVATHNGVQTAVVSFEAIVISAQFTPKNFKLDYVVYMSQPPGQQNFYAAYNVDKKTNPNATLPILTINEPDGIASITLKCIGPTAEYFDAKQSTINKDANGDYLLGIIYTQPKALNSTGTDSCVIKVVDSAGQLSQGLVSLKW